MFSLNVRMCTKCMPGVCECRKKALDFLELKLPMVVNYYVGASVLITSDLFLQLFLLFVLAGLELAL